MNTLFVIFTIVIFGTILITFFSILGNFPGTADTVNNIKNYIQNNLIINKYFFIIIIVCLIIIYILAKYNQFIKLKNAVKRAKGTIDVYLKKRFDLIPNLVETVKGYSSHEEDLLTELTEIRENFEKNINNIKENTNLYNRYSKIIGVVESYPELKAVDSYNSLMDELSDTEDDIQAARRIYNLEVENYNTEISKVPANILAKVFGYKLEDFFEINEKEKQNVNVEEKLEENK